MKCEVCSELLEEYLDGELAPPDREQVDMHLLACIECSESFAALTAEQELFARYDREIEVPPFLWTRIAAHTKTPKRSWLGKTSLAGAIAVLLIAIAIGLIYRSSKPKAPTPQVATTTLTTPTPNPVRQSVQSVVPKRRKKIKPPIVHAPIDQSDVLSTDLTYIDMD